MRYEEPKIEILVLNTEDIMTTSILNGTEGEGEVLEPWQKM